MPYPPGGTINHSAPRRIRPDRRLGQQLQLGSIVEPAIQASFPGDRRLDPGLGGGLNHAGVRDRRIESQRILKMCWQVSSMAGSTPIALISRNEVRGPGRMFLTTFRFQGYGQDPFATVLLDQMLQTAAAATSGTT